MTRNSRVIVAIGLALAIGPAREGVGQGLVSSAPGTELDRLSRRMADATRDLAEDISLGIGQTPLGQSLLRDVQELQQANGSWYSAIRSTGDAFQVRRSYAGIDISWHRLRGQLAAPGLATPAMAAEVRRVEEVDRQVHQALGLNAYPAGLDGNSAPSGFDEARRLAYALAQRGEALASAIQADYGPNPRFNGLINDSAQLARMVDDFYDRLNATGGAQGPDLARRDFAPIFQRSNALGISLGGSGILPPRVQSAWDAYTSAHNLLRANLGLNDATPDGLPPPNASIGIPVGPNPSAQVARWAVELDRQVGELLANFAPTARVVPEGREMLVEMERLRDHARAFRRDSTQGADPGVLAFQFREVDADWQRLARRFDRVARGRTGPNIQRVQQIGQSCEQIHRVLGMPGFAPVIQSF